MRDQLAFTLQVITATESLLREAAQLCEGDLRDYYLRHLDEEKDHAKWLAEDLEGHTIGLSHLAVALAGSQYYLIKHVHPACLLGYMLALENPAPIETIEALEAVHGKKLLRTARLHAVEDVAHRVALLEQVGKLPPHLQDMVYANERQTNLYMGMR